MKKHDFPLKHNKGDFVATRDGYGDALVVLGEAHEDIVVLDADLAKSTKSILFGKKFPNRFKYMGISEMDMISTAAGLARSNKVPFASSFAAFVVNRALDQIRVNVAYSNTNVKIVGSHAGLLTGQDGPTGQGIMDIAIMRSVPNFSVLAPSDYYEAMACTELMYETKGPFYMRTAREKTMIVHESVPDLKLGKIEVLREGEDASIVACGSLVPEALKASFELEKKGVFVSVLNCFSIKPFDASAIVRESKKGFIVSVEDGIVNGLGSAIAEVIAEKNLSVKLKRIGLNNGFGESGDPWDLLAKYKMDSKGIVETILSGLKE